MLLQRYYDDALAQASFLVGDPDTHEAIVVDPNRDVDAYLAAARAEDMRIVGVTETHIHADFLSGTRELAQRAGATAYLSDEGDADWKYAWANEPNVVLVRDGDAIRAGRVRLDVVATPGHTPEHVSFVLTDEAASLEPLGVFTEIVDDAEVEARADWFARKVAKMPADGIVMAKEAFRLVEQLQAYQGEEAASYLFHAYGTNLQFEDDEFNFVKVRAKEGTKRAFQLRDEHFEVPEP